jgi:capsular polysaccharide biosynthesis protein
LELNEVIGRIFVRHRNLILALLVVGLLCGFAVHAGEASLRAASARLVLDTPDPEDQAESGVIADTSRAIATGPSLVRDALAKVGAHRDPLKVAKEHVEVQALGSSGVIQLTVTDTDPRVAVALANAIAMAVIDTRLELTAGQATRVARELEAEIAQLQKQVDSLDGQITPGAANVDNQLLRRRDLLVQRINQLQTDRASLEATRAVRPKAAVLDAASPPAQKVPGRQLPDLVLGGLLGLLVGVGIAAAMESLRPTLVGRTAIARGLDAPVLAELAGPPQRRGHRYGWVSADIAEAAMHVELVAAAAEVQHVRLMALDRQIDLASLVQTLGEPLKTATVEQAEMPTARRWRPGSRTGQELEVATTQRGNSNIGLVLVTPTVLKLADLDPVKDFLTISGWPLLGVIVYQPRLHKTKVARTDRSARSREDYTEVDV